MLVADCGGAVGEVGDGVRIEAGLAIGRAVYCISPAGRSRAGSARLRRKYREMRVAANDRPGAAV